MYAFIHDKCGNPAFLLTEMPEPGSIMKSATARYLDGSPIGAFTSVTCESCGEAITNPKIKSIVPFKI